MRFKLICLLVLLSIACLGCDSNVDVAEGLPYLIVSQNGTLCLDIPGGSRAEGVGIILWGITSKTKPVPNQNWLFYPADEVGEYRIVSANSDLVMDIPGGSVADGVEIVQWRDNGSGAINQTWLLEKSGSYVKIKSKHSGKYLTVLNQQKGKALIQSAADAENEDDQLWTLTRI